MVSNLALGLWSSVGEVASIWTHPFSKFQVPGTEFLRTSEIQKALIILGRGGPGIISRLGVHIIMKFVSGFIFRIPYAIRG